MNGSTPTEWLMIACMSAGGLLGAIGGTGFKPARRFILPIILGALAFLGGYEAWRCLVMAVGMIAALALPYGERTPYPVKFLVGCAFVAPTLVLGFSAWQVITPVAFIAMFKLSNSNRTAAAFSWKIVEFVTFAFVGVTVANLIQKRRKHT